NQLAGRLVGSHAEDGHCGRRHLPGGDLDNPGLLDLPRCAAAHTRPNHAEHRGTAGALLLSAWTLDLSDPAPAVHAGGGVRAIARRRSAAPGAGRSEVMPVVQAACLRRLPHLPGVPDAAEGALR